MRLIDVHTLRLVEFHNNFPDYAILSHTWGGDHEELTCRDVADGNFDKPGLGAVKFRRCCEQAKEDGLAYAWIDTCCIDKTNLVELSEAINSMFRWYRQASVCYAYLSDVPDDDPRKRTSKFQSSRWFSRGWTLQELLAPRNLRFYSSDWRSLGTRGQLAAVVEKVANIPRHFLIGLAALEIASVAQRMSWAAKRETKREEDLAYCLLGIFGVAMPMVYGEGAEQAFARLQDQIMRTTRDDSILAWHLALERPSHDPVPITPGKVLAAAPSDFASCGHIVSREQSAAHSLLVSGGSLRAYLSLVTSATGAVGLLRCGPENDPDLVVGIPLAGTTPDEYFRPSAWHSVLLPRPTSISPSLLHIENSPRTGTPAAANRQYFFSVDGCVEMNLHLIDVEPPSCWDRDLALIKSRINGDPDAAHQQTFVRLRHAEAPEDFIIVLEVKEHGSRLNVQPRLVTCHKDTGLESLAGAFRYLPVCGKRHASSGIIHLRLEWTSSGARQMCIVRVEPTPNSVEPAVDITPELQKFYLRLKFLEILEEKRQNGVEEEGLVRRIKEGREQAERTKQERAMLDDMITELEEKRRILIQKEEVASLEMSRLQERQEIVKTKRADVSIRRLQATEQWTNVLGCSVGDNNYFAEADSTSLLQWACESGNGAIVQRLLDIGDTDCNSIRSHSLTLLHIASRNGHEAVAKLLLDQGAALEAAAKNGRTALHLASANGHEAVARLLLDRGAALEAVDKDGWTALHIASWNGHEAVARLLLDRGAALEAVDKDGWTALHLASQNGHEAVARLFLDRGAGLEAATKDGRTALHLASWNGHEAVAKLLLDQGAALEAAAKDGRTALHLASTNGHEAVARLLLDRGAGVETVNKDGWTALHIASWNGHEAVARLLLDRGAALEAVDKDGWTALYLTSQNGHEAVARLLLNQGAGLEAATKDGKTALHVASWNGHEAVARLLLDRGAGLKAVFKDGWTALHVASWNGHEAVARLLLDRGAALEAVNKDGWTALYLASWNGHEAVARLLLDQGAVLEAATKDGRTALHLASWNGHEAVARLLLDQGAALEAAAKDGRTALHLASWNGHEAVARLLLDQGAVLEAATKDGRTALHLASWNGYEAVARLLLDQGAVLEAVNKDGKTALHLASRNGHEAVARLLLDRGAVLEAVNKDGKTALYLASTNGHEAVARLLLDRGAVLEAVNKDGKTALHLASWNGHEAIARLLLDRGAVNREKRDKYGKIFTTR